MQTEVRNAASPKQVNAAKEKQKFSRDKELNDVRYILNERSGRRFLWRYLSECGVYRLSFTGNSHTFFNEGRREIGLKLLDDITAAAPEKYLLMQQEAQGDLENDR